MKIVVIGSINMDYTLKVAGLPQKGETLMASAYYVAAGGKGANQAVAAARLGGDVAMIGSLGKDDVGRELCSRLESDGIDTSAIKMVDTPTGNAMITVDKSGSNTIVVYPGSNDKLDEDWLSGHEDMLKNADYIILQLEIPLDTVGAALRIAKKYDCTVILNPAPAKELPMEFYQYIDYITPNETELAVLTGTSELEKGAEELLRRGVKRVIVTLGEEGCYYADEAGTIRMEGFKVAATDTTAAGDTFNGAFCIALSEGKQIREALRFANAAAAISVTKSGAQESVPSREEVDNLL